MAEIRVAKVESDADVKSSRRELYAMVAFYYPQYTLKQASHLKARDIYLLLKIANKMEAIRNLNMTQIVASPHSKKGASVKKLVDHFNKIIKG